jgi:hypothetical protein
MRHLPVALIMTATLIAGCQPMSMPPVEELSPPQQALAQVIPPRGGVVMAAFTDPELQPQYLTDDLVQASARAAACHQDAYGEVLEMNDILPILTTLSQAVVYESQIETARAAQISVLTGRGTGAERLDVTLLRDGAVWKIADLSHGGKLLSGQLGGHCDYIAREAAALERVARQTEVEVEGARDPAESDVREG